MSEPLRLVTATDSSPAHADALSFEEFFESEKAGLYGALCLITRNRHEAEEITQDTFVRILERWDRVGTLEDPRGYLYRSAMNAVRSRYRRSRRVVATLFALMVGACTSTDPPGSASSPTEASPTPASDVVEGMFDVGGYELYMRCARTGSPTVVYLHGSIPDPAFQGHSSALAIQDIVDEHHRMCIYDRVNVGLSDRVAGPLDGESSVADLHGLLAAAGIEPPYVLLPASFGGVIADIYAATYPDEVVGMVQLDAPVPDTMEAMKRFIPKKDRLQPDDWIGTNEEIDELAVFAQAKALEGRLPAIPMTYLASDEPLPDPKEDAAWRTLLREFVNRFSPGRLIFLDAPHYMEPEIPDRIAREIERLIAESEGV